jgi:uncharacterized protein YfcZ (UPF0381/DUF406 family)
MRPKGIRWQVMKDYYRDGDNLTDEFPILYGTKEEAEAMMANLEKGSDKSWYDPSDIETSAFLYVDSINLY